MESLEAIQTRHRKEQKDLQARITQKKKNASKKTRKGVNSECDTLEQQLKERQEQELRALNGDAGLDDGLQIDGDDEEGKVVGTQDGIGEEGNVNGVTTTLEKTTISNPADQEDSNQPRKRNRQKERLARRAAEAEAAIEAAKVEAANQPDQRAVEREKLYKQFEQEGLREKLIRPDGHCLFSAVADQLGQIGVPLGEEGEGYKVVRRRAAGYIEEHPDDFVGWLEEPLEDYVTKIRDTAEWGGHLELLALAKTYNIEICVIQDGGRQNIEPGENKMEEAKQIWLAYYKHGFGLGEHYNSLRKAP